MAGHLLNKWLACYQTNSGQPFSVAADSELKEMVGP